jgi:hypothetical protein
MPINYPTQATEESKEQQMLCETFKIAVKNLDKLSVDEAKQLTAADLALPSARFFNEIIESIRARYKWFDEARDRLVKAEGEARSPYRALFLFGAPVLLSIAFGISLARARFVP